MPTGNKPSKLNTKAYSNAISDTSSGSLGMFEGFSVGIYNIWFKMQGLHEWLECLSLSVYSISPWLVSYISAKYYTNVNARLRSMNSKKAMGHYQQSKKTTLLTRILKVMNEDIIVDFHFKIINLHW